MKKKLSKRLLSITISLAMAFGMVPLYAVSAAGDVNVGIVNAGFEDGLVNGEIPGWGKDALTEGLIEISSDVAKGGSNSLHLHDTDSDAASPGLRVLSDKIAVTPGNTYTVQASVYVVQQTASIVHEVQYFDTSDKEITPRQQVLNAKGTLTLNAWDEIVNVSTAPANASYARIGFYSGKSSLTDAYFDDVSMIEPAKPVIPDPEPNPGQPTSGLVNSGFEMDLVGVEIPGWAVDPSTAANGSIGVSSAYSRTGNNSLLFEDKVNGTSPNGSFRMLSDPISVSVGDMVTFEAFVYKVAAGDQTAQIQPVIHYYDAAGNTVKTNDFLGYGNSVVPVGQWYNIAVKDKVVPANTAYIKVGLYSGFPSLTKLYVDDTTVIISHATSPEEIPTKLINPSFDLELVEGKIPGWTLGTGTTGQFNQSTEYYLSGPSSLYFKDSSITTGLRVVSNKVAVTPGESLVVKANVYVIEQSHNIVGQIYYYNAQNVQISAVQDLFGAVTLGNKKWTEMRMFGTVPAGATYATIALYSGDPSITEAYFDDVSIEVMPPEKPLDRKYEAPVDLGAMVSVSLGQSGAIQTNANGENEVYFVTNGLPGTFYVVDGETGKLKFSEAIPNTEATWAMTVGSDKNVYFASTMNGTLYRYLPVEKKVESLGYNSADNWVWDIEEIDGKIYGGTYNSETHGKLFEYDIATKETRNYGAVQSGQQYVRGIAVDEEYIYAGLGTTVQLFKVNRKTGEKTEIIIPGETGTGAINSIADVFKINNKLFVSVSTINMIVLDLETNTIDSKFQYSNMISEPYPEDPNLIYYKDATKLYKYDISAKKSTEIPLELPLPDTTRVKDISWIKMNSGEKAGKTVLAMVTQYGEYILYDPIDHWVSFVELEIDPQPVRIQGIEVGFDGRLYMGGYQRGMSIYNPFTNNIDVNVSSFAQPEGIGFLNDKVYYGTYVSAIMYSYDPTKPITLNENPELEYQITHQDRPFAITSGDNKLFVGTVPDYGFLGGALAIFDEATDTWKQYDQVVKNQSIIGLAYKNGLLYGGTTVWGGLGIEPSEPEAKIFVWDVEKGQKIDEFTLDIPGIDEVPRMISEISFGPDGLLWGAVDGTIFAMDVDTKEIIKSKMIRPSTYNTSKWMPFHLRWAPDGLLYTTLSRKVIAVDPETLEYKIIVSDFLNSMTIGIDGSIFYAPDAGVSMSRIAVPQTDATLSAITVNGVPLEGFSPGIVKYKSKVSPEAVVQATATQSGATVTTEVQAKEEKTVITVVGTDGKSTLVYTIHWNKAGSVDPGNPGNPGSPGNPSNPPSSVNPPVITDKTDPNTQTISESSLKVNKQGVVSIEIEKGKTSVLLPVNAAGIVKDQSIVLTSDEITVELASEVLNQLQKLASSEELQDAQIKLSFDAVPNSSKQTLLNKSINSNHANIQAAGEIYDFNLSLVGKDGKEVSSGKFAEPLTLTLKVNGDVNLDLVGIYKIEDDGTLTYMGGTVVNGQISAEVQSSGKYAVLEFDKSFGDVPVSHWAANTIKKMAAMLIAKGVSDTDFAPSENVTRAEFAAFMVRALGLETKGTSEFADVAAGKWYASDVAAAYEAGLVNGMSDTEFAPNRTITREEMAVMLLRAFEFQQGMKSDVSQTKSIADQASISPWASASIKTALELGLVNGRGNNQFVPQGQLTRAESMQAIFNMLSK